MIGDICTHRGILTPKRDSIIIVFVNRYPIGYLAGDVNLYRYVNNRAQCFTDPKGESWKDYLSIVPVLGTIISFFNPPKGRYPDDYIECSANLWDCPDPKTKCEQCVDKIVLGAHMLNILPGVAGIIVDAGATYVAVHTPAAPVAALLVGDIAARAILMMDRAKAITNAANDAKVFYCGQ